MASEQQPRVQHSTASEDAAGGPLSVATQALRKHWGLVVAAVLLAAGIALVFAKTQHPVFEAVSLLEINPHATQPLGDKSEGMMDLGPVSYWDTREYYETQYKIITSRPRARAASRATWRSLTIMASWDTRSRQRRTPTIEAAIAVLRGHVTVEPIKQQPPCRRSKIDDTDPKRAKRICDAIATAYIEPEPRHGTVYRPQMPSSGSTASSTTSSSTSSTNENALHEFKRRTICRALRSTKRPTCSASRCRSSTRALTRTRTKSEELACALRRALEGLSGEPRPAARLRASRERNSSVTTQAVPRCSQGTTLSLLAEGKGENHPLVKRADEKVARNESRAACRGAQHSRRSRARSRRLSRRKRRARQLFFEATRKRAVELNMKEIEYHRLDRAREQNEKLYAYPARAHERGRPCTHDAARTTSASSTPPPSPGHQFGRALRSMTVGVGCFLGLLFGIAVGLAARAARQLAQDAGRLRAKLGVTFLGPAPGVGRHDARATVARRRRARDVASAQADGPPELVVHDAPAERHRRGRARTFART